MSDDEETPAPRGLASRVTSIFGAKPGASIPDPELKERMRTLEPVERKWGFGAAAIPLVIALILLPSLLHNTKVTAAPVKHKCAAGFRLLKGTCTDIEHPSQFVLRFLLLAALGLLLLFAVWASKRTLAVFLGFLAGLAAGPLGLLCIFYGGWLLVRSWRLQRYGATDGATVRKVATERSAAKREAKKAAPSVALASGKAPPPPSKRYTPKAKPRKK